MFNVEAGYQCHSENEKRQYGKLFKENIFLPNYLLTNNTLK